MSEIRSPSALQYLGSVVSHTLGGKFYPVVNHFLAPRQILTLIEVCGGEEFRVPTKREYRRDLFVAMALYFIEVEGRSWAWIGERLDVGEVELGVVRQRYLRYREACPPEDLAFLRTLRGVRD